MVTKDVAPGTIVAGVPAKSIKTVEESLNRFTDLDSLYKEMELVKSCKSVSKNEDT